MKRLIALIVLAAVGLIAADVTFRHADDNSGNVRVWYSDETGTTNAHLLGGIVYDVSTATPHVRLVNPLWTGSTVGNTRGNGAVDLQIGRDAATRVASGQNSFAAGTNCIASANYTTAIGYSCEATGLGGVALGFDTTATQGSITAGDKSNITGARWAVAFGNNTDVLTGADYAVVVGQYSQATAPYTFAFGHYPKAYLAGALAHSGNQFSIRGDSQTQQMVASRTFTDAGTSNSAVTNDWGGLWLLGDSPTPTRIVLPANTTWAVEVLVTFRGSEGGTGDETSGGWKGYCVIERDGSNNTALVGVATTTTLGEDDADLDMKLVADDTNEALEVQVYPDDWQGGAVARIVLTECGR